jgi:hypothetical protein
VHLSLRAGRDGDTRVWVCHTQVCLCMARACRCLAHCDQPEAAYGLAPDPTSTP